MTGPRVSHAEQDLEDAVEDLVKANVPDAKIQAFIRSERQRMGIAPQRSNAINEDGANPTKPHGDTGSWGDEPEAKVGRGSLSGFTRAVGRGATMDMGLKGEAYVRAGIDKLRYGTDVSDRARSYLKDIRGASEEFGEDYPVTNAGAQLAGAFLPVGPLGLAAKGVKGAKEAGAIARTVKATLTGAGTGALAGAVNADDNKGEAAIGGGIVGGGIGGGLHGAISLGGAIGTKMGAADKLVKAAEVIAEKIRSYKPGKVPAMFLRARDEINKQLVKYTGHGIAFDPARSFEQYAETRGSRGRAATEVAERLKRDAEAGHVAPTATGEYGDLALDTGGMELEALAKDVARSPGGRKLRTAVEERAERVMPETERALETATGQKGGQGSAPLRQRRTEQKTVLDDAYDEARDATQGLGIKSPTLEEIKKTPSGRIAWERARSKRLDRPERPILRETETIHHPPPTPPGFDEKQWAKIIQDAEAKGTPLIGRTETIEREVADAELIHMMKQELSSMAKLGSDEAMRADAQAQARLFDKVRDEMGPEFQHADDIARGEYQRTDALRAGERITKTADKGSGRSLQGDIAKSRDAIVAKHEAGPGADLFREGAARSNLDKFRGVRKDRVTDPKRLFGTDEQLAQLRPAFKDQAAFDDFAKRITEGSRVAKQRNRLLVSSETRELAGEAAAREGADVMLPLAQGNFGQTLGALMKNLAPESKRRLNSEIADILARQDAGALTQAKARAEIRQAMMNRLARRHGVLGGMAAEGVQQR